jgi:hypothetical protein
MMGTRAELAHCCRQDGMPNTSMKSLHLLYVMG